MNNATQSVSPAVSEGAQKPDLYYSKTADGRFVLWNRRDARSKMSFRGEQEPAYIVRAVQNHSALVQALEAAHATLIQIGFNDPTKATAAMEAIRAALAATK